MRNYTLLSLGISALILATQHAQAQTTNCAPRDAMVERLAAQYGERRQAMGLGNNNTMVEFFVADADGSWSVIVTAPGGMTCLVAAASAFQLTDDPLVDTSAGT